MRSGLTLCLLFVTVGPSYASSGVDEDGIDATGLMLPNGTILTGAGIGIGQVEGFRPGKRTEDGGPDDNANSASSVVPAQVYMGTAVATANGFRVADHTEQVAGVMISTNSNAIGVAPGASLHSGGYADTADLGQRRVALTMNRIATLPDIDPDPNINDEVSAINFSENLELDGGEALDGTSHLSQFIDWSAAQHDVLYVVGGRTEIAGDGPVPTDNFNGITVAASTNIGFADFRNISSDNDYNDDALGDRVSIDLLAPGELIDVVHLGGAVNNLGQGTSIAAPHAAGAVALLQQYAKFQIENSEVGWVNPNARRHEVMKAILLNSADKKFNVHNSEKVILNLNGQAWENTPAHASADIPLDLHFGAGHLNVRNALTNFEPGEHDPGIVPVLGWDYGSTGGSVDYIFDAPVSGWIAITLAWDRVVALNDPTNIYSFGDEFIPNSIENQLTNLDLYLLDSDDTIIHSSTASTDSVEHIFFDVGVSGGDYKIRVVNAGGGSGDGQDYALAWWAGEVSSPGTSGDFNGDTRVDGRDFLAWQRGESPDPLSASDLADWQANYGVGTLGSTTAVPEPAILAMLGGFAVVTVFRARLRSADHCRRAPRSGRLRVGARAAPARG